MNQKMLANTPRKLIKAALYKLIKMVN